MSSNKLPTVTSNIPRDLRMFIDRVREVIGSDLVSKKEVTRLIRDGAGGGDGGTEEVIETPTRPTNLTATGIQGAIDLAWAGMTYRGHAHTEIWVCDTDTRDQAVAVGVSPGTAFTHTVGPEVGKFYWVRFVNKKGEIGPFNAENGTYGKSLKITGNEEVLTIIKELDESVLTKLLLEKLSWNQVMELRQEMNRYLEAFGAIDKEYETITGAPAWDRAVAYKKGDTVSFKGGLYEATATSGPTTPDNNPTVNTARWKKIGGALQLVEGIKDEAEARLQLTGRVFKTETGISKISTALIQTKVAQRDDDGNIVASSAGLGMISKLDSTAEATTANSKLLGVVESILKDDKGNMTVSANAVNALETEVKAARGTYSSMAQRFSALVTQIGDKVSSGAFDSYKTTVTNALALKASAQALRQIYAALGGTYKGDGTDKEPPVFATMREEGMVWVDEANGGTAQATYTMKLRAKDNTGEANVGFGMAAVKENGQWVADVRFNCNRFAILDPAQPGTKRYPFIVKNGKVYIDTLYVRELTADNLISGAVNSAGFLDFSLTTYSSFAGPLVLTGIPAGAPFVTLIATFTVEAQEGTTLSVSVDRHGWSKTAVVAVPGFDWAGGGSPGTFKTTITHVFVDPSPFVGETHYYIRAGGNGGFSVNGTLVAQLAKR